MENTNTTIKQKQLQFTHKDIEFKVQTVYDTSNFSDGNLSFWQFRVIKVDNQFLDTPLNTNISKTEDGSIKYQNLGSTHFIVQVVEN